MSEWQPIETAPRDGTEVILGSLAQTYKGAPVPPRVTIGYWTQDDEPEYEYCDPYWMSWDGGFTKENPPTHWMPLPPPPEPPGRAGL